MCGEHLYRQTKGTAMGAAYAPNYAGLFMGLWEEKHLYSLSNPFLKYITWYGRYIDDLFFIFTGNEDQLKQFHNYLNDTNKNIKLSLEYSQDCLNFLDLQISLDKNKKLHTSIYRKPTDRNTILRADSYHPKTTISNIPYGQFQRLRRICDSTTDFETKATDMHHRFQTRGYDKNNLDQTLARAKTLKRKDLLTKRKRPQNQQPFKTFFSMRYGHLSYHIKKIILKNWNILTSDPSLQTTFNEPPRCIYRRAPTIKDHLVISSLPSQKPQTWLSQKKGTFRCGNCSHCDTVVCTDSFVDVFTQKTYTSKQFANCNSTYVVYRLECECGCFYVGRTKRKFRERLAEHKYAIRTHNLNYPMAKHFKQAGHSSPNSLRAMVIEVVPQNPMGGDRLQQLLRRETFWIDRLNAMTHPGLNEEIEFSPFL